MPVVSEVSITRKFNLGNYETIDVSMHAYIGEGEDPQQALAMLEHQIVLYIQKAHPEAVGVRQTAKYTVEEFKGLFPADLQSLLSFELTDDYCVIKPRQFLGSENFGKIAEIVRGKGGEYVSSGKDSHFRIPLKRREN